MNEPNPPITGQAARMTTTKVDDDTTLVCVIHLNASPVFVECCAVTRAGASRRIGKSPAGYRFDSASAEAYADGTVRLWLSCWPDGQSGTEAAVRWVDFPGALPPQSSIVADGGLVVPAQGELWAFAQAPWVGEQAIPLGALIPPSSSVMVRLVVSGAPGRMARLNNGAIEGICQVAGVRSTIQGEVALDAAQTLHLSVAQELSECHVQIIGWR